MAKINRVADGVLLLEKPAGLSSNDALQKAKRLLGVKKAGHTGSLDPFACGMLPLCFGQATKFAQYLIDKDKTYLVKARIGLKTDTGDTEGKIVERDEHCPKLCEADMLKVCEAFLGEQSQIPPMHSAVKINGKRLYKLARRGVEVDRPARSIHLHEITHLGLERVEDGYEWRLRVTCSKGTYIRVLIEDMAQKLGTIAHTTYLERTRVGHFNEPTITLEQLEQMGEGAIDALMPLVKAAPQWPMVTLDETEALRFRQGQKLVIEPGHDGMVRVVDKLCNLVGFGQVNAPRLLIPKRIIQ